MVVSMPWRVDGWAGHLMRWIAPSTTVYAATTTGSRNSVSDARETAGQTVAAHTAVTANGAAPAQAAGTPATRAGSPPAAASASAAATTVAAAHVVTAPLKVPVQPEATAGTSEPLRETARRSLVPRWLARLHTQAFTGLAAAGLFMFAGLAGLVTSGLTAGLDLASPRRSRG